MCRGECLYVTCSRVAKVGCAAVQVGFFLVPLVSASSRRIFSDLDVLLSFSGASSSSCLSTCLSIQATSIPWSRSTHWMLRAYTIEKSMVKFRMAKA